jgi:hypothetical protein
MDSTGSHWLSPSSCPNTTWLGTPLMETCALPPGNHKKGIAHPFRQEALGGFIGWAASPAASENSLWASYETIRAFLHPWVLVAVSSS